MQYAYHVISMSPENPGEWRLRRGKRIMPKPETNEGIPE
jgi:hypothetical protein